MNGKGLWLKSLSLVTFVRRIKLGERVLGDYGERLEGHRSLESLVFGANEWVRLGGLVNIREAKVFPKTFWSFLCDVNNWFGVGRVSLLQSLIHRVGLVKGVCSQVRLCERQLEFKDDSTSGWRRYWCSQGDLCGVWVCVLILDFIDLFYDILMDFNYLAAPQLSVQNSIKTQKNINYKRNAERPPSLN